MTMEPVVAQSVRFETVEHVASNNRVSKTGYLVVVTNLDGSEENCGGTTHGHRTKVDARSCIVRSS